MKGRGLRLAAALGAAAVLLGACNGGEGERPPAGTVSPPAGEASPPATTRTPPAAGSPLPAFTWARLADAPTARLEVAAAAVDGKLYVAGGLTPRGVTRRVEIYDPRRERWSRGPDLPEPLHHASGLVLGGRFAVVGGFRPDGGLFGAASDRVYTLGCPSGFRCPPAAGDDRWMPLLTLPRARGAAAAAVVGSALVVAAGQAEGRLVAETDVYDLQAKGWRDGRRIPTPRDHVAAATDGRFLYVVGGRRLAIDAVLGAFERYDPAANRWTALPALPTPRGGFGAAFLDRILITVGGEGPAGTYPQVESFGPEGRWSRLPRMPEARHGLGAAVIGSRLYVAVGGPQVGGSYSRRLDVFGLGR